MDILMVGSEMWPFAKTGGMADVIGALPLALSDLGERVSVILPCYRGVEEKFKPEATGVEVTVPILEENRLEEKKGEVLRATLDGRVDVYLVKMDEYFDREALYSLPEGDYPDNCARFTFFCRAVLDFLKAGNRRPDVIHCHDWQSALVPIYLNTLYRKDPAVGGIPVVLTVHNLGYQGIFWHLDMKLLGLPWEYFSVDYLEYYGKVNLLKGGLVFADRITTVSRGYAREIQTPEYGYGLEGVLSGRSRDLDGIVNGIDYSVWDPETDPHLAANYGPADLSGKAQCKAALQKELDLPVRPDVPVFASISRLADQKGFDLVAAIMERMMEPDLQFVLLGTGERKYHDIFEKVAKNYPDRTGIRISYDEGLAHRIEAGADIFMMPSRYEPCGLNQLISMKYGTVPLVRATGGLDDTVTPWDPGKGIGNGFKFEEYNSEVLWDSIREALATYGRPREWKKVQQNAMMEDHSWAASAKQYLSVFRKAAAAGKESS